MPYVSDIDSLPKFSVGNIHAQETFDNKPQNRGILQFMSMSVGCRVTLEMNNPISTEPKCQHSRYFSDGLPFETWRPTPHPHHLKIFIRFFKRRLHLAD